MDGFVLDVTAGRRGEATLWVRGRDGAEPLRTRFAPTFYVRPRRDADLARVRRGLEDLRAEVDTVEARAGLERETRRVLRVAVPGFEDVHRVASTVDAWGGHHDLDLYNVDLRPSQRVLLARRLFPFARVRAWSPERVTLRDEQWSTSYEAPPLTALRFDAGPSADAKRPTTKPRPKDAAPVAVPGRLPSESDPVQWAEVRADVAGEDADTVRLEGREEDVLRALADEVARRDPDVVLTRGGDRWLLPYLRHRAALAGLDGWRLGRAADPPGERAGRSFFTYGKVKYRPPASRLAGRLHVDLDDSFFHREGGLEGLVDLARISNVPLAELARLGAGTAVTAIQIDVAARENRLIPWKKNEPEAFKTARALLDADRGGYIFEPRVGLFGDVVELDFASLYPNLMVTRNLSPETMLCTCCPAEASASAGAGAEAGAGALAGAGAVVPERWRTVPQLGYRVCARRGFIPRVLGPLVARREAWKRMRRGADDATRARFQARADVLKWLLVCSFGYQGYRNARFGRIECHEAICAWGRDVLLEAAEVAADHGYDLLHGIVDSLWLRRVRDGGAAPPTTPEEAMALARAVESAIGIAFEPQGRYDWIVFLPTRAHNVPVGAEPDGVPALGALNRYYGCFDTVPDKPSRSQAGQDPDRLAGGRLKVRGVEMRQSSVTGVAARAQELFLTEMAKARTTEEFRARLPRGLEAARPAVRSVLDGTAAFEDLVVTVRVSRDAESYRQDTDARAALVQLARAGVRVPAGDTVRYVVLDAGHRDPRRRVVETRLARGDERWDRGAYLALVLRALESLVIPFGLDAERLRLHYLGVAQTTLA